jgi:large subunit ribosomal protein L16
MFTPQVLKIRKMHKNFKLTWEYKCINLKFGKYGLKAMDFGRLQPCHLETIRKLINRETKKAAKIWYRVFPNVSVTKKPNEVRMGKGKGNHAY